MFRFLKQEFEGLGFLFWIIFGMEWIFIAYRKRKKQQLGFK